MLDESDANGVKTGKFRDLQRLTVQYAKILGLTGGDQDDEDDVDEGDGMVE